MSNQAKGSVHIQEDGTPMAGYRVVARDLSGVFTTELANEEVNKEGGFQLHYAEDAGFGLLRTIEFTVIDKVGRTVKTIQKEDPQDTPLDLGNILIPRADATGWLVTKGTGAASPPVTKNNAVGLLVDNVVAWKTVADAFRGAASSIEFMQLDIDVPEQFNQDPTKESPEMVLRFEPPEPTPANPRAVNAKDDRPERLLIDAVNRNPHVDVRLMINQWTLDEHTIGLSRLLPGLGLLILKLLNWRFSKHGRFSTLDEVQRYFKPTALPPNRIKGSHSPALGPTHAKLAIIDGKTAINIASPFKQGYYGDAEHAIDDPRRGNADRLPTHDVSIAVTGPAVADVHDMFALHWNVEVDESERLPRITPPPEQTSPGSLDALASLQVVRSLAAGRFPDPADGEKGVLEAYLRAIAQAKSLIYIENQFFTDDAIGTALAKALTDPDRPALNVILLLNINPDNILYPCWQRRLVARIKRDLRAPDQLRRFGVFTRWTHEAAAPPDRPHPRIAPVYLHTKAALVDDSWATIGSANLDGASLDFLEYLHFLQNGDVRESELNFTILNGIEQQPQTTAVDLLRRRLWAEHLGFRTADGKPDPDAADLAKPPLDGWVGLWSRLAEQKRLALRDTPAVPHPVRVLPWADRGGIFMNQPREYLAELVGKNGRLLGVDPITGTRRFRFKDGTYRDARPEVEAR